MQRLYFVVALAMLFTYASASSIGIGSFFAQYNISASTVSSFTYTNLTYQGSSYSLVYLSGSPTLLVNTTGGHYSFVNGTSTITPIISSTIINSSISSINATYLAASIKQYNQSSSQAINDCLVETGLAQGYTCTLANYCESCSVVPVCSKALSGTGGPAGPVGYGIAQFEIAYTNLESNLSLYLSSLSSLSYSNAGTNTASMQSSFSAISSITSILYQNSLFPPPQNANFALCSNYGSSTGNISSSTGPWYCNAVGFCESPTYNYSLLGNLQSYMDHIKALPFSQSQVSSIAANISSADNSYLLPKLESTKIAQLDGILNTTLKGYNTTVSSVSLLLTRITNTMLSSQLTTFTSDHDSIVQGYLTANLTAANASLKKQKAALLATYLGVNTTYNSITTIADENTELLIDIQSGPGGGSSQVAQLAFQQAQKNIQLQSQITNSTAQLQQLQSIRTQALTLSNPSSISQAISRTVDAPVAVALLGGSSYSSGVALAPIVSILPSIIIVAIILIVIFFLHRRLSAKRKLHMTPRTRKNWLILYTLIAALAVLYLIATYLIAAAANGPAPLPVAAAAFNASKTIAIAINGTSNAYLNACESQIKGTVLSENKTALIGTINGQSCDFGTVETVDRCLAYYASQGIPMVILSNSSINSLTAYSFYGTILTQKGDPHFTSECPADLIVSTAV